MPPKLANLKPLKHPAKPGRITVPYHERFDLPKHIVKSIIRQAGLTNQQFFDLLSRESRLRRCRPRARLRSGADAVW